MRKTKRLNLESDAKDPRRDDFLVVGIGASAGGIQALNEFFKSVSADSGIAYVVILHLSPDHDSRLAQILQQNALIPVTQVTKRVSVEPNHVYVVPPNAHLTMADGDIVVSPNLGTEDRRAPVDIFFRALAESHTSRAVAVILSGTGANGSMGLKLVKEQGGVCFVQNPDEAEFSEMPRNAIATELIDRVLNVAEIPAQILAYKESFGKVAIPVEQESRTDDQKHALREIFTQIRLQTGHDFSNYKLATVLRRIEQRINVRHLQDLPDYARLLRDDPNETDVLLKYLLISVTNFFRDKAAFEYLEMVVLPKIFAGKTAEDQVRIWVTGCATGEEAYSLAMLCAERTFGETDAPTIQIFATDIDEQAIRTARDGEYTLNDAADVSPERLRRFFTNDANIYRVRRELREMIVFAAHNVLKDPPFSRLDLATCRNVLIYLNGAAQLRVTETLHFALKPGGYLFMGSSETVDGAGELYAPVSREHHVYQSRRILNRIAYPVAEPTSRLLRPEQFNAPRSLPENQREIPAAEKISPSELHLRLLEQFTPSIVVNDKYDIVHSSESAARYLQFHGGEPTRNILNLIRPEIRLEIRSALYQAVERKTNVEIKDLKINFGEAQELINVYVRPAFDSEPGFVLILFEAARAGGVDREKSAYSPAESVVGQLEAELIGAKTQLRSAVEQYEIQAEELTASNEELYAMNEEMRTTAEELETGKEELQSLNEELITVNQELKIKIEELSNSNDDFHNFINSTDIATIFLDRSLRVNSFTPAAIRIFNLIASDYGRPLSDITNNLEDENLTEIAETVLKTLQPRECEIRADDGSVYLQRVLPYRTSEDRINGVVLTFTDVTARKRAEDKLRASDANQTYLLKLADAIRRRDAPNEIQAAASRILGEHLAVDRAYYVEISETDREFVVVRDWHRPDVRSHAGRYTSEEWSMPWLNNGQIWVMNDVDTDPILPDEQRAMYRGNDIRAAILVPLIREGNLVATFVVNQKEPREWQPEETELVRDTAERTWAAVERARAEEALAASEEKFRLFVTASSDTLYRMSADWSEMRWLEGKDFLGDNGNPLGNRYEDYIPESNKIAVRAIIDEAVREKKIFEMEHPVMRADGSIGWTFSRVIPLLDEKGVIVEWFGTASDITTRKGVQEAKFFLASIVESSGDSMVTVNFDGIITSWNHSAATLYGYTPNEAIGKPLTMLTLPEDLAQVLGNVLKIRYSQKVEVYDSVRLRKGGREITLEIVLSPIKDEQGNVVGASTIARDVTERREVELALRESEARFRSVFYSNMVPMGVWKKDGQIADANDAFLTLIGRTRRELESGKISWNEITAPEDFDLDRKALQEVAQSGNCTPYEKVYLHKDGSRIPVIVGGGSFDGAGEMGIFFAVDLTERRNWENALRDSERRFKLASAAVQSVIYDWDVITDRVERSGELLNLLGFDPADETTQTNNWFCSRLHPDDEEHARGTVRTALKNGDERYEDEFRLLHRDGFYVWVNDTGIFLRDENGKVVRCVGSVTNITKRKEAEGVLERYRLISERASDVIWLLSPDGRIIETNQAACDAYGYTREELLDKNVADLRESAILPALSEQVRSSDEGSVQFETLHIRKDGTAFPVEVNATAGNFAGKRLILEIVRDLTERRKSEEALLESETRLRLALEASGLATWEWNLESGKILWNDQHFLLFGVKPHPNPLVPNEFFRYVHVDDRERLNELLNKAIAERSVFKADFRAVLESGEVRWMSDFGRVVQESASGEPLRLSGVMFDVTDRKLAEEKFQRGEKHLRDSEERLRLLIESAKDFAIFTMTRDGRVDSWNTGAENILGWTETEVVGQSGEIIFTPEDRKKKVFEKELKTALRVGRAPDERFHLRKDGSRFYASGVTTTLKDVNGKVRGFVKIARDMTVQKRAEKALSDREILRKLVGAQEDERRRIARDLHDELGQQLTALRINLEKAKAICDDEVVCGEIDKIDLIAKGIDEGVDFLAWELRPAALDQFGLSAALDNYVRQWTVYSGVKAEFLASSIKRKRFSREVETNLYRIAQEALNNISKHARAKNVELMLERRGDLIVLIIQDDGRGFSVNRKKTRAKGIGLIGMEERAAIIQGTLEIESAPGGGTTVFVRVPVSLVREGVSDGE